MRKSLYDGRVEDLEEDDYIALTCRRCGHAGAVARAAVLSMMARHKTLRRAWPLEPFTFVKQLHQYFRCTRCQVPMNSRPHHDLDIRVLTKDELERSALWKNWGR